MVEVVWRGGELHYYSVGEDISAPSLLALLKAQGYDVFAIDYMGLLEGTDGNDQARVLGQITRSIKVFAGSNKSVGIVAAQLSNEGEVRYSRAMLEHAPNAWTWVYTPQSKENKIIWVTQPKSRQQGSFSFPLYFNPDVMDVRDLTEKERKKFEKNRASESNKKNNSYSKKEGSKRNYFGDL